MASKTSICNMALSHLGIAKPIANIDSEQSQEAAACRTFYDVSRDRVSRDVAWPFLTKIEALALVEENPNEEWAYAYRYPSDCLDVRKIQSGVRNETNSQRIPYKIASDDQGLLLFTDREDAILEYTVRLDNVNLYPADFMMALSYRLATYIAARLTNGDPFKLMESVMGLYRIEIQNAAANAQNEEQPDVYPDSEYVQARL